MHLASPACPGRTVRLAVTALAALFLAVGHAGPARGADVQFKRWATDQGMTVLLLERHSLPTVNLIMQFHAGSIHDPEPKAGLAHLTAALLDEGTTSLTASQIAESFDFMGASLSTGADADSATVSLQILKKDIDQGFALLADVLTRPSFPVQEVQRVLDQVLGGIVAEKDDPGTVATRAFDRILYGNHPYHRPAEGLPETLPGIERKDIVAFHRSFYHPNNGLMAVVGDLTEKELRALIEEHLGHWKKKEVPPAKLPDPPPLEGLKIELIDKNLTQANIQIGHLGVKRTNPDFYPILVMNYILGGGGFSSRLLSSIRDEQGLVYSVYSTFDANYHTGKFFVKLQTQNATANRAIQEVLKEIRKIRSTPVTRQELEEAISYLVGSFPLRMDTNAKMARLLSWVEFFGLGEGYFEDYPRKIQAVTLEDVQRVAKEYLNPDRILLVAVTNQEEARIKINEPG